MSGRRNGLRPGSVHLREDFMDELALSFRDNLGLVVTKVEAWELAKVVFETAFDLARSKPLVLYGYLKMYVAKSERASRNNSPPLRLKCRISPHVQRILNSGDAMYNLEKGEEYDGVSLETFDD